MDNIKKSKKYDLVDKNREVFGTIWFENKRAHISFCHMKHYNLSVQTPILSLSTLYSLIETFELYNVYITGSGEFLVGKNIKLEDIARSNIALASIYDIQEEFLKHIEECDNKKYDAIELMWYNINLVMYIIQLHILGKDYYNIGMDHYTCNQIMGDDIIYKFKELQNRVIFWRIATTVLSIFIITKILF